jgi:parvulin-like peptidyl-prolyl isomerase
MATKRTTKKSASKAAPAAKASTSKTAPKRPSRSASRSTASRSTASKATASKVTPETTAAEEKAETKATATSSTSSKKSVNVSKRYIALIATILLLGAALFYFRGLFVAAVVNGQPISRFEVIRETEKKAGKQTLDTLIRDALIEQKAKEQNVTINDQEVDAEIKKLQDNLAKQGQNLDQVLEAQGMTQDDVRRYIRLDLIVRKIVGKDVNVTDEEVNKYIEENREALPEGQDEAALKKQVIEQLKQQKSNEKIRVWLADLQKEASVTHFVQY